MSLLDMRQLRKLPVSARSFGAWVQLWWFAFVGIVTALLFVIAIAGRAMWWSMVCYHAWVAEQRDTYSKTWLAILRTDKGVPRGK